MNLLVPYKLENFLTSWPIVSISHRQCCMELRSLLGLSYDFSYGRILKLKVLGGCLSFCTIDVKSTTDDLSCTRFVWLIYIRIAMKMSNWTGWYIGNSQVTPWRSVLIKLIVRCLVKITPILYENGKFITLLTTARHSTLSRTDELSTHH
jgi:hypothetical protein